MIQKQWILVLVLSAALTPVVLGAPVSYPTEELSPEVVLPPLTSLPVADTLVTMPYLETLSELESLHGATVVAGAPEAFLAAPGVLVTQLHRATDPTAVLFLFYDLERNLPYFLRIETDPFADPSVRLWGPGSSEIVFTEDGARLVHRPSDRTFRLTRGGESPSRDLSSIHAESTADMIACIGRSLGISLRTSSLRSLLSSASCSATSTVSLVLTAFNCLSVPHPAATVGCTVGIAQAVSCGFANCSTSANCVKSISFNRRTGGSWSSSCRSVNRAGSYAKFFTFRLSSRRQVTIDLDASVDSYLYLLQGSGTNGRALARDDDSGPGSDARISVTLNPGTYTIEATTYRSRQTGSFVVSVSR